MPAPSCDSVPGTMREGLPEGLHVNTAAGKSGLSSPEAQSSSADDLQLAAEASTLGRSGQCRLPTMIASGFLQTLQSSSSDACNACIPAVSPAQGLKLARTVKSLQAKHCDVV